MKLKFLTTLATIFTLFLLGCSTEETQQANENSNLTAEVENTRGPGIGTSCPQLPCKASYDYPIGNVNSYIITYSSNLTLGEIECLRQSYFNCYRNISGLHMYMLQPSDPYVDVWGIGDGKPHTSLDVSICSDPEMGGSHCD